MKPPKKRPAVTRLELLVLIVLVLVLLGVFVNFIGRHRDEANRVHCINNLRRIGAGVLGFHEERKFLPAARIAPGYATWAVQIAPFLAKESALLEWDFKKDYAAQAAKVREAPLAVFFCPSRRRSAQLSIPGEGSEQDRVPGALGDYACASGDGDPQVPWTGAKANGALILGEVLEQDGGLIRRWRGRTNLSSLVRGQSYTVLAGDKHVPDSRHGHSEAGDGSLYNGALPASFARVGGPGFGLASGPAAPFNTNFGSAHLGLCQFLHADGSVQRYTTSLSAELLGKMIRRD